MNGKIKSGLEVTKPPRSSRSRGMDEVCRKLTALSVGKRGLEVQLNNCKDRMRAIEEILGKIRKEESYLLDCLKQGKVPQASSVSDNGNGNEQNEQHIPPETSKAEGKEVVFRF